MIIVATKRSKKKFNKTKKDNLKENFINWEKVFVRYFLFPLFKEKEKENIEKRFNLFVTVD